MERISSMRAEGTGLYLLGATINHSCQPNIALTKPPIESEHGMDDSSAVIALRPIKAVTPKNIVVHL